MSIKKVYIVAIVSWLFLFLLQVPCIAEAAEPVSGAVISKNHETIQLDGDAIFSIHPEDLDENGETAFFFTSQSDAWYQAEFSGPFENSWLNITYLAGGIEEYNEGTYRVGTSVHSSEMRIPAGAETKISVTPVWEGLLPASCTLKMTKIRDIGELNEKPVEFSMDHERIEYSFTVPEDGTYDFQVKGDFSSLPLYLTLHSFEGWDRDSMNLDKTGGILSFSAKAGEKYFIRFNSWNPISEDHAIPVTLQVSRTPGAEQIQKMEVSTPAEKTEYLSGMSHYVEFSGTKLLITYKDGTKRTVSSYSTLWNYYKITGEYSDTVVDEQGNALWKEGTGNIVLYCEDGPSRVTASYQVTVLDPTGIAESFTGDCSFNLDRSHHVYQFTAPASGSYTIRFQSEGLENYQWSLDGCTPDRGLVFLDSNYYYLQNVKKGDTFYFETYPSSTNDVEEEVPLFVTVETKSPQSFILQEDTVIDTSMSLYGANFSFTPQQSGTYCFWIDTMDSPYGEFYSPDFENPIHCERLFEEDGFRPFFELSLEKDKTYTMYVITYNPDGAEARVKVTKTSSQGETPGPGPDPDQNQTNPPDQGETNPPDQDETTHTHAYSTQGILIADADCTYPGLLRYPCTYPGCKEYREENIPALGHSFGDYVVTEKPTALSVGQKVRTCIRCDASQTQELNKLKGFIKVNATSVVLKKSQSTKAIKVTDMAEGDGISSWTSSNQRVASVTSSGKITGKGVGRAKITITLKSGVKKTIAVKVQKKEVKTKKITLAKKRLALSPKKSFVLTASLSPITSAQKIKYTSSNKKVASVNAKGKIIGKKRGKTKITVQSGSKKAFCMVTVR